MKRIPSIWKCAGTLFLMLGAACGGPISGGTPTSPPGTPLPLPPGIATAGGHQPTAAAPTATQPPSGSKPSTGPVALQVTTPQDGAVVNTPQIQVSGTASPGAVVSVNDIILIVGVDGTFATTVSLDSGPNLIEVVASNDSGDQKTVDLTVTYEQ